jgi:hypothetical protein
MLPRPPACWGGFCLKLPKELNGLENSATKTVRAAPRVEVPEIEPRTGRSANPLTV